VSIRKANDVGPPPLRTDSLFVFRARN